MLWAQGGLEPQTYLAQNQSIRLEKKSIKLFFSKLTNSKKVTKHAGYCLSIIKANDLFSAYMLSIVEKKILIQMNVLAINEKIQLILTLFEIE